MKTLPVKAIVFREDIYPRKSSNQQLAQDYAESVDNLPPIEVNQDNVLIDGWHRWTAHRLAERKEIGVTVTKTKDDAQLIYLAGVRNAVHGSQLTRNEKKRLCLKLLAAGTLNKEQFAKDFGVSRATVYEWTQKVEADGRAEKLAEELTMIRAMWMQCHTEDEIAGVLKCDQKTVTNRLELLGKSPDSDSKLQSFEKEALEKIGIPETPDFSDFTPPIYNVWAFSKRTNSTEHFGNTEERITENLLWLYTKPGEIVIDPFGGGGSTLDVCMKRGRRCWISDRKPKPGLEKKIRTLDICAGLPPLNKRWSDVSLTYLDPPYWRQAAGQYSKDAEDLANMPLEQFTDEMVAVVRAFAAKQSKGVIALIIQPTQWKADERRFTDHVFDIVRGVEKQKNLTLENRVSCPYSTEQCTPQMVEWAKKNHKLLVLSRELIIWRVQ